MDPDAVFWIRFMRMSENFVTIENFTIAGAKWILKSASWNVKKWEIRKLDKYDECSILLLGVFEVAEEEYHDRKILRGEWMVAGVVSF